MYLHWLDDTFRYQHYHCMMLPHTSQHFPITQLGDTVGGIYFGPVISHGGVEKLEEEISDQAIGLHG